MDTNSIKPTENNSNSSNVYTTNEVSNLENKTNTVDKKIWILLLIKIVRRLVNDLRDH